MHGTMSLKYIGTVLLRTVFVGDGNENNRSTSPRFHLLKAKGQISTVHAMKELDGVQRSASVCGRFTPEEISLASQKKREAEKDENPELTVLKKEKHLAWNRKRVSKISTL